MIFEGVGWKFHDRILRYLVGGWFLLYTYQGPRWLLLCLYLFVLWSGILWLRVPKWFMLLFFFVRLWKGVSFFCGFWYLLLLPFQTFRWLHFCIVGIEFFEWSVRSRIIQNGLRVEFFWKMILHRFPVWGYWSVTNKG